MKTDALFLELTKRNNIYLYKEINKDIVNQFEEKYSKFKNKFFYEQFTNSGGIVIDHWIRIYGCGDINVVVSILIQDNFMMKIFQTKIYLLMQRWNVIIEALMLLGY